MPPAAQVAGMLAVTAGAVGLHMHQQHRSWQAERREKAAEEEWKVQMAAELDYMEGVRQRAAESASEQEEEGRRQGTFISDVFAELSRLGKLELAKLVDRLDMASAQSSAAWTRSPALAVALCAACLTGNFELVMHAMESQHASTDGDLAAVSALGLSCTRISPRSARIVHEWLDSLAAKTHHVPNKVLSTLTKLAQSSCEGIRDFDILELSGDDWGEASAEHCVRSLCALGFQVLPLSKAGDTDVASLCARGGIPCICAEDDYCAELLQALARYDRKAQELRGRREFRVYGDGCTYATEAQLQAAFRAESERLNAAHVQECERAAQSAVSKLCFVRTRGSRAAGPGGRTDMFDARWDRTSKSKLRESVIVLNFPEEASFECTLSPGSNSPERVVPLTGPDYRLTAPQTGDGWVALHKKNAGLRGVGQVGGRKRKGQRKSQARFASFEFEALGCTPRSLTLQRAEFFAEQWLRREVSEVSKRLAKLSRGSSCMVGASIEHCCAIGGSVQATQAMTGALQVMRQQDLARLDSEQQRDELEDLLISSILTTVPPARTEDNGDDTAAAVEKHEAQVKRFTCDYVDMIRGGHRRPARSLAGQFPYELVQASTPHFQAMEGVLSIPFQDCGEAQLASDLHSFHSRHEDEARNAGPLVAKSTATQPLWWSAGCGTACLALAGLAFWAAEVSLAGLAERFDFEDLPLAKFAVFACSAVLAVASVGAFVHYLGNFADVRELPEGNGLLHHLSSTLHVYSACCRSSYLALAQMKGWVSAIELDLQRLEHDCEKQMREWEFRLLGEEIGRHVKTKRISTTELKFLLTDLTTVATDEAVDGDTIEVELPCPAETAEQFLKLPVTQDTASSESETTSTPNLPRRRVADILDAAAWSHAAGMRPADVKQIGGITQSANGAAADSKKRQEDEKLGQLRQQLRQKQKIARGKKRQQKQSTLRFSVGDAVLWHLGDRGHEMLQSTDCEAWLRYHHIEHLKPVLERDDLCMDMEFVRLLASDSEARVDAFEEGFVDHDGCHILNERDESLLLTAIEHPDRSWYRGTVEWARGPGGVEEAAYRVLLDDGRSVAAQSDTDTHIRRVVDGAAGAVDDVEEDEDEGDSAEEDATTQTDSAKPQSVNEAIAAFGWEVHRGGKHIKLSRKLELADGSEVYQRGPTLSCVGPRCPTIVLARTS
eukprot:COSAG04_NODE_1121_length_8162_cov_9.527595_2_plen_1179_part_00